VKELAPQSFWFRAVLGLITATQALGSTIVFPALPAIAAAFTASAAEAQSTVGGYLLGVASGQLLWGALADRFGRRPVMLAGMALFTLMGLLAAVAPSILLLFLFRALQGVGGAAGMIVGRAIVRDLFRQQEAVKTMSFIGAVISLMPLVAPVLGGVVLEFTSWRGTLVFLSALSAASMLAGWRFVGESIRTRDPEATNVPRILSNIATFLRTPACLWFTLVMCTIYGGMMAVMVTLPYVAISVFGVSPLHAAWLVGAMAVASFTGTRVASLLADRWKPRRTMGWGIVLASASAAVLLVLTSAGLHGWLALALIMVPLFSYCIAFSWLQGNLIVAVLQPVPQMAGVASATAGSVQMAGGGLMVWLGGLLFDGTPSALGYGMAIGAFAGTAFFLIGSHFVYAGKGKA
jgi:DHA1 family bicyclomycin/chloramphenicol resistance-like MFS transporter